MEENLWNHKIVDSNSFIFALRCKWLELTGNERIVKAWKEGRPKLDSELDLLQLQKLTD